MCITNVSGQRAPMGYAVTIDDVDQASAAVLHRQRDLAVDNESRASGGHFAYPCDLNHAILRVPSSHSSVSALLVKPLMYRISAPG